MRVHASLMERYSLHILRVLKTPLNEDDNGITFERQRHYHKKEIALVREVPKPLKQYHQWPVWLLALQS